MALLGLLAALGLGAHLLSCLAVALRLRRPAPLATGDLPRVALLRPVCGLDRFDGETLLSSFHQDHPDHEVVFCAAREDDAAVPLVRALIAAHPGVRARLLVGDDRISGNPKLDNLAKGVAATDAPWLVMADSNLLLPPDYLRRLQGAWAPGVGLVSSPPIGTRPQGLWGALECAILNTNQARLQLLADSLGMGFAQGKTLAWRRDDLLAVGGLPALGARLAEDAAATIAVRARGLRVRLTQRPFEQPIGARTLAAVWARQLRWSKVRRDAFPGLFLLEPFNGAALPSLALLLSGLPVAWLLPFLALWFGAEAALAARARWPMGPLSILALPLRDLLLPALWLATFGSRGFTWRGTAMGARPAA